MTDRQLLELLVDKVTGIEVKLVEHDKKFEAIDKRFASIEKKLEDHDKRFDVLETRFDGLETRFDVLETRFDGLETRFGVLETRFDGLETEVSSIKATLNRVEAKQQVIFEQTAGLLEFRTEMQSSVKKIVSDEKFLLGIVGEHEMYIRRDLQRSV